ncbi:MAG TPA: leucyl aminopeptidase [Clostridiales bacterium]|nr:MAG: hypothetical protein A2Y22_06735 [Clostridiales bacterium GWD2_32_59]HAN09862.1 leucyl aminopeptidase [Clostridiales bacterium]
MYKKFKEKYDSNTDVYNELQNGLEEIKKFIQDDTSKYADYFKCIANFIVKTFDYRELQNNLENIDFDTLLKANNGLYMDIHKDNYDNSYANPEYTCNIFGKELGQILTYIYAYTKNYIDWISNENNYIINQTNKLILTIKNMLETSEKPNKAEIIEIIKKHHLDVIEYRIEFNLNKIFNPEVSDRYRSIIENGIDIDMKYLFKYNRYIGDAEIKTARFLNIMRDEQINDIAITIVEAFKNGYARDGKDITKKSNIRPMYQMGEERIVKKVLEKLESINIMGFSLVPLCVSQFKQYEYDHEFDAGLYFDKDYVDKSLKLYEEKCEKYKDMLIKFGGPIFIETFGQIPFSPKSKDTNIRYNDDQNDLDKNLKNKNMQILNKYATRSEYSFTIVALPNPEIGDRFEEIFEETCKVNTLDNDKYEKIHQKIINILDKADFVHVKGKGDNLTDIKIKMQKINSAETETLFENCVANVNIPVGEVFTSPKLTETSGTLHVTKVYLNDYLYKDLLLVFKDGYVVNYNCKNFETEEQNKKYIEENLLHPYKSLPMGEFAIGTNTTAYVMARKYDIGHLLPILIAEKTGPHFAIGDTCFSHREDLKVYNNIDGKEIIARDNEKSILRRTNPDEAYTNKHTDITIPYDELDFIRSVTGDGEELSVIEKGRFVVEGTEELNEVFN